ncbi:hypothetical protein QBC43DRAFT_360971 [Cladorrhinum sp. PSN259]|nr:hypothetical protein QBC43DRAFT_360971 [Cladorrhinum sp. PSN259]
METSDYLDDDDEVIFVSETSNINHDMLGDDDNTLALASSNSDRAEAISGALSGMSSSIQRKRTYSQAGFDSLPHLKNSPIDCPKFVVLHINVLVDGRGGVIHTITQVFKEVLPNRRPPAAVDILRAFAAVPMLDTVLRTLTYGRISSDETSRCSQAYMRIFDEEALPMMCLYDDVKPFLRAAKAHGVTTMLQTDFLHKAEALIDDKEVMNLLDLVVDTKSAYMNTHTAEGDFVMLGDTNIMKAYARHYAKKQEREGMALDEVPDPKLLLRPSEAMVVSCAPYGLKAAKLAGAKACWMKKSEFAPPQDLQIDYVVQSLEKLGKEIFKKCSAVAQVKAEAKEEEEPEPVLQSIEAEDEDQSAQTLGDESSNTAAASLTIGCPDGDTDGNGHPALRKQQTSSLEQVPGQDKDMEADDGSNEEFGPVEAFGVVEQAANSGGL